MFLIAKAVLKDGFPLIKAVLRFFYLIVNQPGVHIMNKDTIKIIKRNKKDETEKIEAVVVTPKAESDTQRGIVNTVKNWISERRENSLAEKVFRERKFWIE